MKVKCHNITCAAKLLTNNLLLSKMIEYRKIRAEINEYIYQWIKKSVSLDTWLSHGHVDVIQELKNCELSGKERDEIFAHMHSLYKELRERLYTSGYIKRFHAIKSESDKVEVAKNDINLINHLIDGNIDETREKRLKMRYGIKDWRQMNLQFHHIIHDPDNYPNLRNIDIHSADRFLQSEVILMYKKALQKFLAGTTERPSEKKAMIEPTEDQPEKKIVLKRTQKTTCSLTLLDLDTKYPLLTDLFNVLKRRNLVALENKLSDFRKVFSGKEIERPIIWTGSISELAYFIKCLHDKNERKVEDLGQQIWKVTVQCFVDFNGKQFQQTQLRQAKKPRKVSINIIKRIVSSLTHSTLHPLTNI